MISHPEFVVIAFAFRFLLVCSAVCLVQRKGELNYLMINILELNQSSSDENDLSFSPSNTSKNGTICPTTNLTDKTSSDRIVLTNSTQDPTTMVPTSPDENVSTFSPVPQTANCPPETRLQLCSRVINITWLSFAPFIFQPKNNTTKTETELNGNVTGVFYSIIGRAVQFCCKHLGNRGTRLEYTHKAENINTLHANIFYDKASIGMPVYIENEFFDQHYGGTLAFIKVLESPGLIVIGNKDDVKQNDSKVLWKTIYNQWPIVLISVLLCAISGICVWVLDTIWNTDEFPRRFHRGAFEGFWWAFVTMSTVGYGDKAPKSVIARLFSIVWIVIGLTVCSVLTATFTTALATAAVKDVDLVGKKIAVLKGSLAFQEVIKQGGNPTLFENFEDMQKALLNTTVTGIMDEMYHGLYWMHQVRDSRLAVVKMIERTRSYGFAFKKDKIFQWPTEECIRKLILYRREDVYYVMKQFKDEMKDKLSKAMDDDGFSLLDRNSPAFCALVISLIIFLGALIAAIRLCELLLYLYQRFVKKKKSEDNVQLSSSHCKKWKTKKSEDNVQLSSSHCKKWKKKKSEDNVQLSSSHCNAPPTMSCWIIHKEKTMQSHGNFQSHNDTRVQDPLPSII